MRMLPAPGAHCNEVTRCRSSVQHLCQSLLQVGDSASKTAYLRAMVYELPGARGGSGGRPHPGTGTAADGVWCCHVSAASPSSGCCGAAENSF